MAQINLTAMGIICALGNNKETCLEGLLNNSQDNMRPFTLADNGKDIIAGRVSDKWLSNAFSQNKYTRNNRLLLTVAEQIKSDVESLKQRYSADRIGVVLGTSTSGILEGEQAVDARHHNGHFPDTFHYSMQEMGDSAHYLAEYFELSGPAMCISTACSSSGKAFASARQLIESGFCDAVICGGSDTLCQLTTQGFSSLEAVSETITNPFSKNRDGINIGEGASLFICEAQPTPKLNSSKTFDIFLAGFGESSDAYHISAPHPEGRGAKQSMQAALDDASLQAKDIGYLNCHGTGTQHNDAMESIAAASVLPPQTLCSSTKPLTGHTLGAAGAIEAAICYMLLSHYRDHDSPTIPAMLWDGERDPELAVLNFASEASSAPKLRYCMSNSFAFGGSNVTLILGIDSE